MVHPTYERDGRVRRTSDVQPRNAEVSYVFAFNSFNSRKEVQAWKALEPTEVAAGNSTEVRPVQPWKAELPTCVTAGRSTSVRPVQPWKAPARSSVISSSRYSPVKLPSTSRRMASLSASSMASPMPPTLTSADIARPLVASTCASAAGVTS